MKISMIGHFGGNKKINDGQTVKTKEIRDFLFEKGFEVSVVDTYFLKRKPLKSLLLIKDAIEKNDAIILIVSSRGYKIISPFLVRLNKHYNRKLFDFVIGGFRYRILDEKPKLRKVANCFTKVYVETERMKREYEKRGVRNVEIIPNFKKLKKFSSKKSFAKKNELHTCMFSRIIKEKGIGDAIEAIKIANTDGDKKYYLDIYGRIDDKYEDEFYLALKNNQERISYKGEVNSDDASNVIRQYDVLLFPTYWKGEGFPGTLIDAFFAAVPIIATDWNDNFEILKEGENGIMVHIKSPVEIAEAMKKIANNQKMFKDLSKANCDKADDYMPEEVMKPFFSELGDRREG